MSRWRRRLVPRRTCEALGRLGGSSQSVGPHDLAHWGLLTQQVHDDASQQEDRTARDSGVCLVSSSGGHLELLIAVREVVESRSRTWVTSRSPRALELHQSGETVRLLPGWDLKTLRPRGALAGVRMAERLRPDVVVTSGAGMVVPFCVTARALGAQVVFAETMARISTPSVSGRVLSKVAARVFVQWPEMRGVYPGAVVCRPALLEGIRPTPVIEGTGTLVVVGTHNKPFDRLLHAVDEAIRGNVLPRPVLVQSGVSDYRPRSFEPHAWLSALEMTRALERHRYVVCHAGAGIVSSTLRAGRRPVVFPRRAVFDEHVDDHQVDLADTMDSLGLAVHAEHAITAAHLERTSEGPLELPPTMRHAPALVDALRQAMAELGA